MADDIMLPTRYVRTTSTINTLTGITVDEKTQNVTARSKLIISKIKKDDEELIAFESKPRNDRDYSEISKDAICTNGAIKLVTVLRQYQDLCRDAVNKAQDKTEVVFSENEIKLTFNSKDKGHKNYFELSVEDIAYVLNSQILVTKLISILSPMIGGKSVVLR
jgi:hypothetical protein